MSWLLAVELQVLALLWMLSLEVNLFILFLGTEQLFFFFSRVEKFLYTYGICDAYLTLKLLV